VLSLWTYKSAKASEGLEQDQVEFSPARYEPMARLMDHEDLLFLQSQPGFRPEMGKKFSRERRRIFRLYLRELACDFHRLHAHARVIVASLPADHSPLVGMLIRQQVRFWYEMAAIEMRLSFDWVGATSIHARGLIDALATMHAEIGRVAAPMTA
jgi:hypothetical protein